jgi:hypothetical protein
VAALEVLASSVEEDAALNLIGRMSGRDDTLRMARTHLRIESALRDQPSLEQTALPPPIFVVGWPRTGTTFLHTLLAQDPASRTIPYWESFDPLPPEQGPDRRAAKVDRMLAQLARFAPAYQAIHPMTGDAPEECVALFMNVFRTLQFDIQYRIPGYVEWLLAQDAGVAYAGYRRQLALLQHHRPCGVRQVLKDPTHLVHLEALLELFPDARVVYTHRDPAQAMSSLCSLYAHTRSIFSDDVDGRAIGAELMEGYWPRALDRAIELREKIPAERRTDVRYVDLVRDPLAAAAGLYSALGIDLEDRARAAMERFVRADAARDHGVHLHALEDFGLQAAAVRERFEGYCSRFDLSSHD